MPAAVITGASSGIGRATAEEFARRGYRVVVLARRKDLLKHLTDEISRQFPQSQPRAVVCDISNWEQVEKAAKEIGNEVGAVNVLINNAGAFEYSPFEKSDPKKLEEMIDVNVKGLMYVTRAFLPLLKRAAAKGERAKIVNVSSISGLWGFSNMAVYTATKFAVTGFTSALRRELKTQKIDVASIHPGPVRSKEPPGPTRPKKAIVMLPPQIAAQIFGLATSKTGRHVSHPIFSILSWLESWSPTFVDKVLRQIL